MSDGIKFIAESNRIEGIVREPTDSEINEFMRFMALDALCVADVEAFVKVYQPNARLRDQHGLNVTVGNHFPPAGAPYIRKALNDLLYRINQEEINSFEAHVEYETFHPFTDGNGRSGRMIWAWMETDLRLGFLHKFYYQTLDAQRPNT